MVNDFVMKTGTMTPQQVVDNWRQYQPGGGSDPWGANSSGVGGDGGMGGIILPQRPTGSSYTPDELNSAVQFGYGSMGGNHYGDRGYTKNAAGNYDYSFKDAPPSGVMDDLKDFGVHFALPAALGALGSGAIGGSAFSPQLPGEFGFGPGLDNLGSSIPSLPGPDWIGGGNPGNVDLSGLDQGSIDTTSKYGPFPGYEGTPGVSQYGDPGYTDTSGAPQYGSPGYSDTSYNPASNPGGMGPGADQYGNYDMGNGISGQASSASANTGDWWDNNLINPLKSLTGLNLPSSDSGFPYGKIIGGLLEAGGSLLAGNSLRNLGNSSAARADPFASQRGQYQAQLSNLTSDPSSFFNDPAIKAAIKTQTDATQRSLASQGYNMSGNMGIETAAAGQRAAFGQYLPYMDQIGTYAGGKLNQGNAGGLAYQGGAAGIGAQQKALGGLGSAFDALTRGEQPKIGDMFTLLGHIFNTNK